jgi:hypothetical protein
VNLPLVKKNMGIAPKEKYRFWLQYFRKWYEKIGIRRQSDSFVNGKVCLFSDEFTNFMMFQ